MIIICTPIFLPVVKAFGIDPGAFRRHPDPQPGIGLNTPPVGSVQFVACAVGKITIGEAMSSIWPFYGAGLARAAPRHLHSGLVALASSPVPLSISISQFNEVPMTIEVRQVCHPDAVRLRHRRLRRHFLIEELFVPGQIKLTYSHIDRLVVGGATPTSRPLRLEADKQIGSPNFLDRRELGVVNLGGPARVHDRWRKSMMLGHRDALYVGDGQQRGALREPSTPTAPRNSTLSARPRTRASETVKIRLEDAKRARLGERRTATSHDLPV